MLPDERKHWAEQLQPGGRAWTDFSGMWEQVDILERTDIVRSESNISYRVNITQGKGAYRGVAWLDSHWFYPQKGDTHGTE